MKYKVSFHVIGVHVRNRTLHGNLEIHNFTFLVEKYFTYLLHLLT